MSTSPKTIVAFGNSITLAGEQPPEKRWSSRLEAELNRAYPKPGFKIVNAGVGGNTSREGLARIEKDVLAFKPDYAIVEFGGNDASYRPERHVPLPEYEQNLEAIRKQILAVNPGAFLIMCTFPPIIDEQHCYGRNEFYKEFGGPDKLIEKYRKLTVAFAEKHHYPVADLGRILRDETNANRFTLPDGVHLTEAGNRLVAETIFAIFRESD